MQVQLFLTLHITLVLSHKRFSISGDDPINALALKAIFFEKTIKIT